MRERVPRDKVWDFFYENKEHLQRDGVMMLLAANDEYGTSIYISEEDGLPQFVVLMEDDPVFQTEVLTKAECSKTAAELYDKYLTAAVVSEYIDKDIPADDEDEEEDKLSVIDHREQELYDAAYNFLADTIGNDYSPTVIEGVVQDFLDHSLEYLYRKHKIEAYRPMFLEDDKGEFFEEFPYASMVFEDADNPLYKA